MPKVKVRPAELAKIHRSRPLNEYGPCSFENCMCHEFEDDPASGSLCANCHHERQYHMHPWHT